MHGMPLGLPPTTATYRWSCLVYLIYNNRTFAIAFASPATLRNVLMDPPRVSTKRQAALIVISNTTVDGDQLAMCIENVKLLQEPEFRDFLPVWKKLQILSGLTVPEGRKRSAEDQEAEVSATPKLKKSRRLGVSPSDASLHDGDVV